MHKNLPTVTTLFIVAILGALVGIGLYRFAQGQYPVVGNFLRNLPRIDILQNTSQISATPAPVLSEITVENVVEQTSPSVVAIGATRNVFNPFNPFAPAQSQSSTIGTGFVVSEKGIVVTNKHVVNNLNAQYQVIDRDGKKYAVQKIYQDPISDLALVQISGSSMKALPLGDSSKLKVGQTVIAIGNALGQFTNTVTTGIVSGLGRQVVAGDPFSGSSESLDDLIQTDAAINPGNSGGPLLNSAGQVIGVNVATTEGAQNIGFAIPINSVKKNVDEFVATGTISKPFLGIKYKFISKDLALLNEVPQGAYIQEIVAGSAASKAAILTGDIIIKIDGQVVDAENKLSQIIADSKVGDRVELKVWRNSQEITLTATLQNASNQ